MKTPFPCRQLASPLLAALGLLSSPLWATDLLSIYHQAQGYDAVFSAATAAREAGQEKVVQGRAGLLPQISANANTNWNNLDNKTPPALADTYRYNSNGYQIQLSQPLFRWQNWVGYQQGALQTALSEIQYNTARQDLMLRVCDAYFAVLTAQEAVSAIESLKQSTKQQLALAQKSFEVGTVTVTDVHEAQSRHDLATAQLIAAQNDLDVRRQTLAQLTGDIPNSLARLQSGITLQPPQPANAQSWVFAAQNNSFSVQARQVETELAQKNVERNRAGHLPTLDAVASYGHAKSAFGTTGAGSDYNNAVIGLQLNVPLFAGGGIASATREAIAQKAQSDANLLDAQRSAALAARQAYLNMTSGLAQISALEAAKRSSTSALEANQVGYEVGVRINIDVLNAQTQLADTTRQLAKARHDTLLAQLQLKAAAGSLGEDDLAQVNALLTELTATPIPAVQSAPVPPEVSEQKTKAPRSPKRGNASDPHH